MKTLFLSTLFLFSALLGGAQIFTVNNSPNQSADYTDLQVAINSVSNGSILLVQGSGSSYGNISVNKPVVIIGPGYNLDKNPAPHTQANGLSAHINTLSIVNAGSGAMISGMTINGNTTITSAQNVSISSCMFLKNIQIQSSGNITIQRNLFELVSQTYAINNLASLNTVIRHNIFNITGVIQLVRVLSSTNSGSSTIAEHNIIKTSFSSSNNIYSLISNVQFGSSLASRNNIWINTGTVSNKEAFKIYIGNSTSTVTMSNEVVSDSSFKNYSNIVFDADPADMFQHWGNTAYGLDYILQTKAGSPAIGAGLNGVDCGAYGGTNPYLMSGLSLVPNIYELSMPSIGTTGYGIDVHIKAKANQ